MSEADLLPAVLQLWQQILPAASLQPDTHFLLAGGDSLQLSRLLLRVQQQIGVSLRLQDLGTFSTPRKMALVCASSAVVVEDAVESAPMLPALREFVASSSQQGLWWSEQHAGNVGLYNSVLVISLSGKLEALLLAAAIDGLLQRFPLLASGIAVNLKTRHLMVSPAKVPPRLGATIDVPSESLPVYIAKWAEQPLELASGVFRCQLLYHAPQEHSLLLCVHHCVSDGWSGGVLLQQLAQNYRELCLDPDWRPAGVDHAFANHCWQLQDWIAGAEYRQRLDWWRQYLGDADAVSGELPWQPLASHWPYALRRSCWKLPDDLPQQLRLACIKHACTPFSLLATALAVALRRAGSGVKPLIGFPFAGRTGVQHEQSVGCYMQLMPLWLDASDDCPWSELLQRNHAFVQAALAHAVPLPDLVNVLRPSLLADGNAWFDVVLALQNFPLAACDWFPLSANCQVVPASHGQYALKLEISDGLITAEYARSVIDTALVEKLMQVIQQVLTAFAGGCA